MVHFAVSSMFFHEYPLDDLFSYAASTGLDGIEFWLETPHFWLRGLPVGELLNCITKSPNLAPVTVHAPILDLNPCSINPAVASLTLDYTVQAIEIAEQVGAEVVTVHPGRRTAKRTPTAADYDRFEQLIATIHAASQGKRVKVAIENMEEKVNSLLCTPDDVRELLDREPWLFFTLDTSHALAKDMETLEEYVHLCHDRMVNIHVSGVADGRLHLPLTEAPTADPTLSLIAAYQYRGYLTLEIEDLNFSTEVSAEEKVMLLRRECELMQEYFR
jgi:sugar phosphate isomerase/epimerase